MAYKGLSHSHTYCMLTRSLNAVGQFSETRIYRLGCVWNYGWHGVICRTILSAYLKTSKNQNLPMTDVCYWKYLYKQKQHLKTTSYNHDVSTAAELACAMNHTRSYTNLCSYAKIIKRAHLYRTGCLSSVSGRKCCSNMP